MAGFRDQPFNTATLAKRLSSFWRQQNPHLLIAADAVSSVKQLVRSEPNQQKSSSHTSIRINQPESPNKLLHRLYNHGPLQKKLDAQEMSYAVFVEQPRPSLPEALELLKHTSRRESYFSVLRTELYRKNWLGATQILGVAPCTPDRQGLVPMLSSSLLAGIGLWAWSPYWVVGGSLAVFWLGLARALTKPVNSYTVQFIRSDPNNSVTKLEMAHLIVSWYDETMALTVENYHRKFNEYQQEHDHELSKALDDALRKHNIRRRSVRNVQSELYGKYWSGNYDHRDRWEWVEPDQDPAHLRFK